MAHFFNDVKLGMGQNSSTRVAIFDLPPDGNVSHCQKSHLVVLGPVVFAGSRKARLFQELLKNNECAAVILEPVVGNSGFIPPTKDGLREGCLVLRVPWLLPPFGSRSSFGSRRCKVIR